MLLSKYLRNQKYQNFQFLINKMALICPLKYFPSSIKFNVENNMLAVATSSLNGEIWNGEVLLLRPDFGKGDNILNTFAIECGVTDVCWLSRLILFY